MSIEIFAALAAFAFVSAITPGPNNLMLLSSAVNFGFRRSVPHMLGITIGFSLLVLAIGAGMGSILATLPWLYTALKIGGGLYLLYLAWKIAISRSIDDGDTGARPLTFFEGASFQLVNPKGWIMAVTAMGAYTNPANYWPTMLIVTACFAAFVLPVSLLWAGTGLALRRWLSDPRRLRIFNITMAILLVLSLWPLIR